MPNDHERREEKEVCVPLSLSLSNSLFLYPFDVSSCPISAGAVSICSLIAVSDCVLNDIQRCGAPLGE